MFKIGQIISAQFAWTESWTESSSKLRTDYLSISEHNFKLKLEHVIQWIKPTSNLTIMIQFNNERFSDTVKNFTRFNCIIIIQLNFNSIDLELSKYIFLIKFRFTGITYLTSYRVLEISDAETVSSMTLYVFFIVVHLASEVS